MISLYYEVEFNVPGERLNPPRHNSEWWKSTDSSVGYKTGQFNYSDAQKERARVRAKFGYRTRLRQVKVSANVVEEDD